MKITKDTKVLIINKNGNINEIILNRTENLIKTLAEKCNFKKHDDFIKQHIYDDYEIYGKIKGKSNNKNTYKWPSPIDNSLFYGSMAIIKTKGNLILSLLKKEWNDIYDILNDNEQDDNEEDEEEDEEDEEDDTNIDEDEEDEEDEDEEENEDEDEEENEDEDKDNNIDEDEDKDTNIDEDEDNIIQQEISLKKNNIKEITSIKNNKIKKSKRIIQEMIIPTLETELSEEEYI